MNKKQLQIIDLAELQKLQEISKMGNPHLINQLIDLFLKETPENIRTFKLHVANRELGELQKSAHALKSTCASLGITKMKALCEQLENSKILEVTPRLIQTLEQEYKFAAQELSLIRATGKYEK